MGKVLLWVVCKGCGREFDTRLRLDRKSFEKGTLAANYHACPHCGRRLTYRKVDYLVREEQPGQRRTRSGIENWITSTWSRP